ncbi:hypothetical protein BROUX41_004424 [Berkeleyomyces rouxiae]|uniref:uncharacterized protein n=1 Tax=Berkeleyomyces rouxiae TaxID=2035830 RepID=UPI003B7C3C77
MKFFSAAVFLAASAVSVAAVDENCNAADIVKACLEITQPRLETCTGNDWSCLCSAYTDVATCYNNCPNDTDGVSAKQQVDSFCAAASQFPTSTAASGAASGTGSIASATSTGSSSRASGSASGTSGSSASETATIETTGAGAKMAISGAALVAAVAALL